MAMDHFIVTPGTTGTTIRAMISSTIQVSNCRQVFIQAARGNSGIILGGGSRSVLSTTNYGFEIPIPVTTIPAAPFPIEASNAIVSLADIKLLCANTTDKATITVVTA